jgi:hypothetical protein
LEDLKEVDRNCADQLYMSLDAEIGGLWQSLWRERESHDIQICEGDDGVIHYGTHEDDKTDPGTDAIAAGMVKCSDI